MEAIVVVFAVATLLLAINCFSAVVATGRPWKFNTRRKRRKILDRIKSDMRATRYHSAMFRAACDRYEGEVGAQHIGTFRRELGWIGELSDVTLERLYAHDNTNPQEVAKWHAA